MAIPLLGYPLSTQNGRVSNLAGDNSTVQSQLYPSSAAGDDTNRSDMDAVIEQAYRQVFFHAMRSDREPFLESQLRSGNITVRDFIRGLLLSERFQRLLPVQLQLPDGGSGGGTSARPPDPWRRRTPGLVDRDRRKGLYSLCRRGARQP